MRSCAAGERVLQRPEARLVDVDGVAALERLFLGEADGADLGTGEDRGRDQLMIGCGWARPRTRSSRSTSLRGWRRASARAGRSRRRPRRCCPPRCGNSGRLRCVRVGVNFSPAFSRPKACDVRPASDGEHDLLGVEGLAGGVTSRGSSAPCACTTVKTVSRIRRMPFWRIDVLERVAQILVEAAQHLRAAIDQRHLGRRARGRCGRIRARCSRRRRSTMLLGSVFRWNASSEVMQSSAPSTSASARGITAGRDQDRLGRHIAARAHEMDRVRVLQHRAIVDDDAAGALDRTAVVAIRGARSACPCSRSASANRMSRLRPSSRSRRHPRTPRGTRRHRRETSSGCSRD